MDVVIPAIYKGNYNAGAAWIDATTRWYAANSGGADVWVSLQGYVSDDNPIKLSASELQSDIGSAVAAGSGGAMVFRWGLSPAVKFKPPTPAVTDVVAIPSEPWDRKVQVAFNVTNSPAAACPDWNQPYLSIVATDNVTGSNYVSVASALSGDTDRVAGAVVGAEGARRTEWDPPRAPSPGVLHVPGSWLSGRPPTSPLFPQRRLRLRWSR